MEWAQTWTIIAVLGGLGFFLFRILQGNIEKSEKHQDELRKSELEPIREQVNNHIPSLIKKIQASIEKLEKRLIEHIDKK